MKQMTGFNPCIVIPCYEKHALLLNDTLTNYLDLNLPIIIIDDGSSEVYSAKITEVAQKHHCHLIRNESNGGKGYAIKAGLKYAFEKQFTHAIQIDSDGQHSSLKIRELISKAQKHPQSVISGYPIYDHTISKARYYGRYLTHIWVWIHTLSFSIKDSMCGYRVYPLEKANKVLAKYNPGNKMDFDIEILVYHYWENSQIVYIDVPVTYPENNVSYFKGVDDNILITKMHTRLFFTMLAKLPIILKNKLTKSDDQKWYKANESGSYFLMLMTFNVFKFLGVMPVRFIGFFISAYYSVLSSEAKKHSQRFYQIYSDYCFKQNIPQKKLSYFSHIRSFTNMVIDKLCVWAKKIKRENINAEDLRKYYEILNKNQGFFFISSHFGNIEIIRSIGQTNKNFKINTLMYTKNSQKIFSIINKISKNANMGIIDISEISPALAITLKEKLESKELVFCMGDRLTVKSDKSLTVNLLGQNAILPYGPFLLAHLLDHPIYAIHCFREKNEYRIALKEIESNKSINKNENIQNLAQSYAREVENLILSSPTQWFNFTKIWI
jgi:predicted LPLAT superfamily acyltransferase